MAAQCAGLFSEPGPAGWRPACGRAAGPVFSDGGDPRVSEVAMIALRVLGPLEVTVDGAQADLGGPRQRCVLARLVAEHGRVVSADRTAASPGPPVRGAWRRPRADAARTGGRHPGAGAAPVSSADRGRRRWPIRSGGAWPPRAGPWPRGAAARTRVRRPGPGPRRCGGSPPRLPRKPWPRCSPTARRAETTWQPRGSACTGQARADSWARQARQSLAASAGS